VRLVEVTEPAAQAPVAPTLDEVFRLHARSIERWAGRLGGPAVDSDDVVQEVFVVVQRRLGEFKEDQAQLSTWLFRITANVVRHQRRKERWRRWLKGSAEEAAGHLESGESPSDEVEKAQERRKVYAVLDQMNERYRDALILFEMERLSGEEIAQLCGAKVATVWVWLHRARADFMRRLQAYEQKERA
jgi:RNA polymerase sigma-70 factor, ECF subfamily